MAKKSQSSTNKTIVSILSAIFLIAAALIAQMLGVDILGTEQADEDATTSDGQVVTSETYEGEWYALHINNVLETNDWSLHVGSPIEAAMLDAINSAENTIDAALYELNLESVTQALINARNNGVRVRLVLDDEDAVYDEESTIHLLEEAGMVIYCEDDQPAEYDIRCDDRTALMHNKFLIIDGHQVWMGSMNFTHNGVYNNNNNAMLIRSIKLAENYQAIFNLMFDGMFNLTGVDQNDLPNRRFEIDGTLIETYFSPDDGNLLEERIVELLNEADTSIYIMSFNLSLSSIGDVFIVKHNAGLDVRAVIEQLGATGQGRQLPPLICAGVPAKTDGNTGFRLHHKVIIIDEEIVITGSFNFSENAKSNSENVLIIHSPELAQQYTAEFNELYNDPRAESPTPEELGCN